MKRVVTQNIKLLRTPYRNVDIWKNEMLTRNINCFYDIINFYLLSLA